MLYIWIIVTLIFSAFFSGTEIAFFSADHLKQEIDINKGDARAKIIKRFFEHPNKFVTTLLVGNNISLVVYGMLTSEIITPLLQWINNDAVVMIVKSVICTIIILFAGEFIPKIVFRNSPNQKMKFLAFPLIVIYVILYPFVVIINLISSLFLLVVGINPKNVSLKQSLSIINLEHYLDNNKTEEGEPGDLDTEVKIIQKAIEFPSLKVRDCMLPRNEIIAVDKNEKLGKLEELFVQSGHTKVVVYDNSIDNVLGYIHSSEIFRSDDWFSKITSTIFVPESMFASVLMKRLMAKKKSMAIVIDEMGGTAGIVTLEDLVEEIFGDIEDEHDKSKIVSKKIDDNNYIFSARIEIDAINEQFGLNLPDSDDYMTLAGFIIDNLERIPSQGEVFDIDGRRFEIVRATSTKIVMVKLTIP